MSDYLELKLNIPEKDQELWIGKLYNLGFENFYQEGDTLSAFIVKNDYTPELETWIELDLQSHSVTKEIITHQSRDWNQSWESNFNPIKIDEQLYVRAQFHPPVSSTIHEIIISPKMAFGTGHHSTTSMILRWMSLQNIENKDVLDFGCGTGILGIYAKMKQCSTVTFIDNEEPAIENCIEHCNTNNIIAGQILLGSTEVIPDTQFDIILANITRNVLTEAIPKLVQHLKNNGILVVSGFLEKDNDYMDKLIIMNGLILLFTDQDADWLMKTSKKK